VEYKKKGGKIIVNQDIVLRIRRHYAKKRWWLGSSWLKK
jgi:hypothetical protein